MPLNSSGITLQNPPLSPSPFHPIGIRPCLSIGLLLSTHAHQNGPLWRMLCCIAYAFARGLAEGGSPSSSFLFPYALGSFFIMLALHTPYLAGGSGEGRNTGRFVFPTHQRSNKSMAPSLLGLGGLSPSRFQTDG